MSQSKPEEGEQPVFAALATATNERQAGRILDVTQDATLYLTWPSGREVYVTGTDAGLYAVGFGRGGGLYLSRLVTPGRVRSLVRSAAEVDVDRAPPEAIQRPAV